MLNPDCAPPGANTSIAKRVPTPTSVDASLLSPNSEDLDTGSTSLPANRERSAPPSTRHAHLRLDTPRP